MRYLGWIWNNTRGVRWSLLARIVAGTAQVAFGLLMVWLCRRFIDETILTGTPRDVTVMIVWLVLTVVGRIFFRQISYLLTTTSGVRLTNDLRLRMYSSLFRRQLYTGKDMHSGDVSFRLTKDINEVSNTLTDAIPQIVITFIQLVGAFFMLRYFDKWLALALIILTPAAIILTKLAGRKLRQMTLDIRQDESRIQMHVQEGTEYNAMLRAMGSEEWITDRLDTMQQHLKGNVMRRTRFTILMRVATGLTFGLGYMLAFVWGGLQLRNGAISFGIMTSFLQLVGQIQQPVMSILNMGSQIFHSSASIDRLMELESLDKAPEEGAFHPDLSGVRLDSVSFRYENGDRQLFSDFSHDFRPGSKTALMGETGAGKTTLFRLLLGFIKPDKGSISLYGSDCSIGVGAETRPDFIYVPQGNTLMSGSIRFNLQVAAPEATDSQLQEVLHIACADFVRDLPQGIDTVLGERGSGLSEGQAQRIAIARGLLRPGSVLLLDEISSSLDEETEKELYSRLFSFCPSKTMIFITHRPTVTGLCDSVLSI